MNAVSDANWREFGLCGQTDPELFFAEDAASIEQAKLICARCISESPCLADALKQGNSHGVQGGLDPVERLAHPDFKRAAPVRDFLPETDQHRIAAHQKRDAKAARRRHRAAELRESEAPAMDGFDTLVHPLDRKARS